MISLDAVLCPCCGAPVDYESGRKATICNACDNQLLVSSADPSRHTRSEIDPTFTDGAFGAVRLVLHPRGTIACPQCAMIYPATVECCPSLIKFAINWYFESDDQHSSSSRSVILEFIRQHPDSARLFVSVQILEARLSGASDIPIHTLQDFAGAVGGELADSLMKYAL